MKQEHPTGGFPPDNVRCIDGLTCPCLPAQSVDTCTCCNDAGRLVAMVHMPVVARRPRAIGGHP